jgi:hypothetical protein
MPTLKLAGLIKKRNITCYFWSPNWGQGLYPGDEHAHSLDEFELLFDNQVECSTSKYFTSVVWLPYDQISYVADLVHKKWGTKCDYYVWNKQGKFGATGLWLTNCTEIALVCYYSQGRKRLTSHFTNMTGGKTIRNNLDFPVIANKSKMHTGIVSEVVNASEMNVGIPMTVLLNHTNPNECIGDWFSGSGSMAVAAIANGRHCVSVDVRQSQVCMVVEIFVRL